MPELIVRKWDGPYSFMIFREYGVYKARRGDTGEIQFEDPSASVVIQNAINSLLQGGTVFLREVQLPNDVTFGSNILIVEDYQGERKFYSNNKEYRSTEETASYIIFIEDGIVKAKNGHTGKIEFSDPDAATVIQSAVNALPNGGNIFFKRAEYEISTPLVINSINNLALIGESGATFVQTADVDILRFEGTIEGLILANLTFTSSPNRGHVGYGINIDTGDSGELFLRNMIYNVKITHMKQAFRIGGAMILFMENISLLYCGDSTTATPCLNIPTPATLTTHGVFIRNLWIEHPYYRAVYVGLNNYDILIDGFWIEVGTAPEQDYYIYIDGAATTWLKNGRVIGGSAAAIYFASIEGKIENVTIISASGDGIQIPNRSAARASQLVKVFIEGVGGTGILVQIDRVKIKGCEIGAVGSNAIHLNPGHFSEISDCFIFGNTGYGIWLQGTLYAQITDNYIDDKNRNGVAQNSQTHGIIETGASDNNLIVNNITLNHLTANILTVGANTIVKDNIGFTTENSGVATIPNGSSSVVVDHGLAAAPSVVKLTGTHSEVKDCWVTNPTSTQFTINASAAVTADRDVYWQAEV